MVEVIFAVLILFLVVYAVNVIPAFMPATWMVLVFTHLQYKLPLVELVLVGAIASTAGRSSLYLLSKHYLWHVLPKSSKENFDGLGNFLNRHRHTAFWLTAFFAGPFPSNQFFIGSGFAKIKLKLLATCFFIGRVANYSFLIWTSGQIAVNLKSFLSLKYLTGATIGLEILGFSVLYLISKISWHKVLQKFYKV